MANQTLADQLEIWGLEDNFLIYTDGSLGFGVKITPKDVGSLSDDALNAISTQLRTFLNSLPSGISLQFIQDIKSGNKKILDSYSDLSKDTKNIFDGKRVKWLPPELARISMRKLQYINAAFKLEDLKVPPGNKLKPLKGKLKNYYSIRVNDQYRVVFKWKDGQASNVKVTDYH